MLVGGRFQRRFFIMRRQIKIWLGYVCLIHVYLEFTPFKFKLYFFNYLLLITEKLSRQLCCKALATKNNIFICYVHDTNAIHFIYMCCVAVFGSQIFVLCLILSLVICVIYKFWDWESMIITTEIWIALIS